MFMDNLETQRLRNSPGHVKLSSASGNDFILNQSSAQTTKIKTLSELKSQTHSLQFAGKLYQFQSVRFTCVL